METLQLFDVTFALSYPEPALFVLYAFHPEGWTTFFDTDYTDAFVYELKHHENLVAVFGSEKNPAFREALILRYQGMSQGTWRRISKANPHSHLCMSEHRFNPTACVTLQYNRLRKLHLLQ